MKHKMMALCVLALAGVNGYCGPDIPAYPLKKNLAPAAAAGTGPLVCFDLDEEVFAEADGGFANMRLIDGNGQEVPFLVRIKKTAVTVVSENEVKVEIQGLEKESEEKLKVIAVKKENETGCPEELEIETGLRNFEKQVAVFGSNDRQAWESLGTGQPVYDYSRYLDLKNGRVRFRKGNFKYYKVEISNISEGSDSPLAWLVKEQRRNGQTVKIEERNIAQKDFRIEKIKFMEKVQGTRENKNVRTAYTVSNMTVSRDKDGRSTFVVFETSRVPVNLVRITTDSRNFSRAVTVEGASSGDEWQTLGGGVISRIQFPGVGREGLDISLSSQARYERYRLKIQNNDSPPLKITGIAVEGDCYEALFFADAAATYALYYGAKDVAAPNYDIAAVIDGARSGNAGIFRLGGRENNPLFKTGAAVRLPSGKVFLVTAVLAAVAVLFWLIAVSVRKLEPPSSAGHDRNAEE